MSEASCRLGVFFLLLLLYLYCLQYFPRNHRHLLRLLDFIDWHFDLLSRTFLHRPSPRGLLIPILSLHFVDWSLPKPILNCFHCHYQTLLHRPGHFSLLTTIIVLRIPNHLLPLDTLKKICNRHCKCKFSGYCLLHFSDGKAVYYQRDKRNKNRASKTKRKLGQGDPRTLRIPNS